MLLACRAAPGVPPAAGSWYDVIMQSATARRPAATTGSSGRHLGHR